MNSEVTINSVCKPSENIVSREILDDTLIVPLVAGIGDADDEFYTLNETARDIWRMLDGQRSLGEIAEVLSQDFSSSVEEIEKDVIGFAAEMLSRKILVDCSTRNEHG